MRTLLKKLVLLGAALASLTGPAMADSTQSVQNDIVRVYRNVSGSTLTSHTAVVLDLTDSANVSGVTESDPTSTVGTLVNTTTSADSLLFAGVLLDDSCVDDALCRFVVEGPVVVRWAGLTDGTASAGAKVGTTSLAGQLGSGSLAGFTLGTGPAQGTRGADNSLIWVYVSRDRN